MNLQLRINGTAPAWPVLLEYPSAFYQPQNSNALGSASYSILSYTNKEKTVINWEVLIDAGHNTVPFLLNHGNRIPDAIILTHGHPDHMLGVDWIVQSHHFNSIKSKNKLSVYCTIGAWNMLMNTYSYIKPHVLHRELIPGKKLLIEETHDLYITAYPAYHGDGALGASMLYFESQDKNSRLLITGDMLCPLLRKKDISVIANTPIMFIDTNNRFPYPESNHMSFARLASKNEKINKRLKQWFEKKSISDLVAPHLDSDIGKEARTYFQELKSDWQHISEIPHTILDFLHVIPIPEVYLIHYWGVYDEIIYHENILSPEQLERWANNLAKKDGLNHISIHVPNPADYISL